MNDSPTPQTTSRFFLFVQRFNSVAAMILLVVLLLWAGFMVVSMAVEFAHRPGTDHPALQTPLPNGVKPGASTPTLRLGNVQYIPGTGKSFMRLQSDTTSTGFVSTIGPRDTRNILIFDNDGKKSRWLLHDNDHVLADFAFLTQPPQRDFMHQSWLGDGMSRDPEVAETAIGILAFSKPSDAKTGSILVGAVDGTGLKPVVDAADAIEGWRQTDPDTLMIVYDRNGASRVLTYSLATGSTVSDIELKPE
jgi:hypothetical protein